MTTEIDAEGLAAAIRAYDEHVDQFASVAVEAAISAYLATTRISEAEPVRWPDLPAVKLARMGLNALYAEVPELVARDVYKLVVDAFDAIAANTLPTPASDDQVEAVQSQVKVYWTAAPRPPAHMEPMEGRQTFPTFDAAVRFMSRQAADATLVSVIEITSGAVNLTERMRKALAAMGSTKL